MKKLPDIKDFRFKDTSFASLMTKRIYNVLLIATRYDSFILEEDGRIDELMFGSYKDDDESLKEIAKMQVAITEKEQQLEKSPLIKEIEGLRKNIKSEQSKITLRKNVRLISFRSMFTPDEMIGEEKEE